MTTLDRIRRLAWHAFALVLLTGLLAAGCALACIGAIALGLA